jgi:hypothetical protein
VWPAPSRWHAVCEPSNAVKERTARHFGPQMNPAVVLQRVQKRLNDLARKKVDTILDEIEALEAMVEEVMAILLGARKELRPRRRAAVELRLLTSEAEAGVASVRITRRSDGRDGFLVSINERAPFHLSPQLGELLRAITSPDRAASDGLVAWRSTSEIAKSLRTRDGGRVRAATVTKIVFRLRDRFHEVGENVELIQVSRRRGVRFALRLRGSKDAS